jgi:glutamine phosphoribosylpyrophosphate amidotransferase
MCSIIGYKGKFQSNFVSKLLDESRCRGIHSFGFHTKNGTQKFLDYNLFKKELLKEQPDIFIAHFRYSTSGDYKNLENNQPLTTDDKSMVFNGVISQLDKTSMEKKFNIELPSDNDGWILFNYFSPHGISELPKGVSYAFLGLDGEGITAVRNELRPLWKYESKKYVVLSSTKDILIRTGIKKNLLPVKANQIERWII